MTARHHTACADCSSHAAGLVDADVEAVLEDSRASRAALLAEAAQQAQLIQQAAVPAEIGCPNSGACDAAAAPQVLPAVPAARQTMLLGANCSNADAGAVPAGVAVQQEEASVPAAAAQQLEEGSAAPLLTHGGEASGSECSVPSRASSCDDEPDSLEELD